MDLDSVTSTADDRDPRGGLDFGWRVHGALDSWTGKVDTKASITLAIESAVLGFVVTLSKDGERLARLTGASKTWYYAGLVALSAAVLSALRVVMPQLKRRRARREWRGNMIYFGHLRRWDSADLAVALRSKQVYEAQLAKQLVVMADIAWKKHARLQWSIGFLVLGAGCFVLAFLTS
jgi:hypothetical protein